MAQELAKANLNILNTWTDAKDWFALVLCQVKK
jgi:uncharacterized SAM-dependent methyltransferase